MRIGRVVSASCGNAFFWGVVVLLAIRFVLPELLNLLDHFLTFLEEV